MRLPQLSPPAFRRLTVVVAVLLGVIVATGAAVRLTSSGLGCPDWPRCTATSFVAPASFHGRIEFWNRVVTTLVGVVVGAAAVGSLLRNPRRRDLVWLSWALIAGFIGQAVVGGLSVLYKLSPGWVMAHFLLSMLLVWDGLVLVHRAHPNWRPRSPEAPRELVLLGRVLVVVAGIVLFLGTVTTGTGPHAGSGGHVKRLPFALERVTQLHADSALLLTGLIIATIFAVRLAGASKVLRQRSNWLAYAVLAQVAIGYTQYFLDLPRGIVELHVAGATVLWSATIWLQLGHSAPASAATEPSVVVRQPKATVSS